MAKEAEAAIKAHAMEEREALRKAAAALRDQKIADKLAQQKAKEDAAKANLLALEDAAAKSSGKEEVVWMDLGDDN